MDDTRHNLRELAAKAAQGKWRVDHTIVHAVTGPVAQAFAVAGEGASVSHNAQYIAAASPMRVLELLDELARATADVASLHALINRADERRFHGCTDAEYADVVSAQKELRAVVDEMDEAGQ